MQATTTEHVELEARLGADRHPEGGEELLRLPLAELVDELRGEEGPEEGGRGLPLFRGEVGVAGGHREAVALAHRRGDEDLHREAEVGDEAHHDGALLRVLLAEDGNVGEDEAEEADADWGRE